MNCLNTKCNPILMIQYTDKKENKILLRYRKIQLWSVAMSYMRKGFLIYEEMRKYLTIFEEAFNHIWLCSRCHLNSLYMRKIWFSFLSVYCCNQPKIITVTVFKTIWEWVSELACGPNFCTVFYITRICYSAWKYGNFPLENNQERLLTASL